jgi:hypothetical protein
MAQVSVIDGRFRGIFQGRYQGYARVAPSSSHVPPLAPSTGSLPTNEQGFAFWYVYENVTAVMPNDLVHGAADVSSRMAAKGWGLFGYKNQFTGLGLFFSNNRRGSTPGSTEFKPSVSVVVNDGSRSIVFPGDIPSSFGSYWDYRNKPLLVRMRVRPTSILIEARAENGRDWLKLGEVPADKMAMKIRPGGYIGFTSFVAADKPGQTPPSQFGHHDAVHIHHVTLTNMDTRQTGEETIAKPAPAAAEKPAAAAAEFLHDKSGAGVERAEGKAIRTLSRMIFKLISETEPLKKSMTSAVASLMTRLSSMERSIKKLKEEIVALSGHDMDAEFESMKKELTKMSNKAQSEVAAKREDIAQLKSQIDSSIDSSANKKKNSAERVVQTLSQADSKARELKNQVAARGSTTLYIAIFCLVLVVAAGVALQAKLKRWEKKHLL